MDSTSKERPAIVGTDPEFIDELNDEIQSLFDDLVGELKCQEIDFTVERSAKPRKDILSKFLHRSSDLLRQQDQMVKDLRTVGDLLRAELLESQNTVVNVQRELLNCKTEQLQSFQTAVKATVQNTVQAEIKSYSSAVAQKAHSPAFTPETLKKVVQNVVEEEDRSKNRMIFGLEEDDGELLADKVCDVFQVLEEKPRVEATRVGKKVSGKVRPVKVILSSSTIAHQIRMKSRKLRSVDKHKNVFICPDRTLDQRDEHRQLVIDLKRKYSEEPSKQHFIKSGRVWSVDKVGT